METAFLICMVLVFYTYLGYPLLIWLAACLKKAVGPTPVKAEENTADVTLVIPAYNEAGCIGQKIQNCLALHFPNDHRNIIVVTDGSVDETPFLVSAYPQVVLVHQAEREGKIQAIHRAMQVVKTELVVFSDANALLNKDALTLLAAHFNNPAVGGVAGEKRVNSTGGRATAGEGWYWYYESILKKQESDFYSVMGAAGELFCIRRELYQPLPTDTIVDDLAICLQVSLKGYRIAYEPRAFATEQVSKNIRQELERKTRIAAGGIQSLSRYGLKLLFTRPLLAFEYFSHRVLRWVLVPYLLLVALVIGIIWVSIHGIDGWMGWLAMAQFIFYGWALSGLLLETTGIKGGWFFAAFYFCLLHYAMMAGLFRYCLGKQTVRWKKQDR